MASTYNGGLNGSSNGDYSSQAGPSQLHSLVLDYITTHAYSSTARALSLPRRAPVPPSREDQTATDETSSSMDVDEEGDMTAGPSSDNHKAGREVLLSEEVVLAIERRSAILNHILNGAIIRAIEGLHQYFPAVLDESTPQPPYSTHTNGRSHYPHVAHSAYPTQTQATNTYHIPPHRSKQPPTPPNTTHSTPVLPLSTHPSHILLNLHIQAFIESFRQLTPSSPSTTPSSSISSLTSSIHMAASTSISTTHPKVTLTHALTAAQGLHTEAKKLPPDVRAIYLQEIKDVGALFAYEDVASSILKGFLEQERRIRLAAQVNRAILRSEGRGMKSQLEMMARRTTAVYKIMGEHNVTMLQAGNGNGIGAGNGVEMAKKEHIMELWKRYPPGKADFSLHDFVGQTWG